MSNGSWSEIETRWKAITCSVTETSPKLQLAPPRPRAARGSARCRSRSPFSAACTSRRRSAETTARPLADVEPLDLVGAAEVEVDRAGVDRREGALGLDQAEHLPRLALDHRDRVGRGRAQRDLGGDELAAPRHQPPAGLAQLARRDQPLGPLAPARRRRSRRPRRSAAARRRPRPGAGRRSARWRGRGSPPRPGGR